MLEISPSRLHNPQERALAKLARIARGDCWQGGARASVLANRLAKMGRAEYLDVVSAAYSNSRGEAREYLAYECPECGSACLGQEAAAQHCQEEEWQEEEQEG